MRLRTRLLAAAFFAVLAGAVGLSATAQKPIDMFSAQAVNFDAPAGVATGPIQIQVTRWSTDAERDQLMTALTEQGQEKFLKALSKQPPVGSIREPDTVGYPLRYARRTTTGGNEQIVIITDRPLSFMERRGLTRSTEYPFTVVELRLRPGGEGDGYVSIAAKANVNAFTKDIELENFTQNRVLLQNVRREKS